MPRSNPNLSLGSRERRPFGGPLCSVKLVTNSVIDARSFLTYPAFTCNWSVFVNFAASA
jgi:hypothetical protein